MNKTIKPFSLKAVLKYRRQLEETAAAKLAQAQLELQEKQKEHDHLTEIYAALLARLEKAQGCGISIEDLLQYENHLSWLKKRKKSAADELQMSAVKVRQKRHLVVDRRRDRKILEKLQHRQNSEWRRHLEKKEADQLDEIAVLAHDREQQKI